MNTGPRTVVLDGLKLVFRFAFSEVGRSRRAVPKPVIDVYNVLDYCDVPIIVLYYNIMLSFGLYLKTRNAHGLVRPSRIRYETS